MKKSNKTEFEGAFIDARGRKHLDTGDLWHAYMPREFWNARARHLFKSAVAAGLIVWVDEANTFAAGERLTKAQLAYWCKRASTYLGLDRGSTTNWKPFERVFNAPGMDWKDRKREPLDDDERKKPQEASTSSAETIEPQETKLPASKPNTALKASLWCLRDQSPKYPPKPTDADGYRLDQIEEINDFFVRLDASTPGA